MNTLAIINGARSRRGKTTATGLLEDVRRERPVDMVSTRGPGHASEIARDAVARGVRQFISVGGDGTLFEVLNGLFPAALELDEKIELGILPLGTGNSFCRDFDLLDRQRAQRAVREWKTAPVDVIRGRYEKPGETHESEFFYINILGIGFVAAAGDTTNKRFKKLNQAGYVAAVATELAALESQRDPMRLEPGDIVLDEPAAFVCFSNSVYTGGAMKMAPNASPSDGLLDMTFAGDLSRTELLRAFPSIFSGTHISHAKVDARQVRSVEFLNPRMQPLMVDGEVFDGALKRLDVLEGALSFVVCES